MKHLRWTKVHHHLRCFWFCCRVNKTVKSSSDVSQSHKVTLSRYFSCLFVAALVAKINPSVNCNLFCLFWCLTQKKILQLWFRSKWSFLSFVFFSRVETELEKYDNISSHKRQQKKPNSSASTDCLTKVWNVSVFPSTVKNRDAIVFVNYFLVQI